MIPIKYNVRSLFARRAPTLMTVLLRACSLLRCRTRVRAIQFPDKFLLHNTGE
jgi:hypothetical protein